MVVLKTTVTVLKKKFIVCLHDTNIWCSPDELHKWAEVKMHWREEQ